jgi:hypothetical protein
LQYVIAFGQQIGVQITAAMLGIDHADAAPEAVCNQQGRIRFAAAGGAGHTQTQFCTAFGSAMNFKGFHDLFVLAQNDGLRQQRLLLCVAIDTI